MPVTWSIGLPVFPVGEPGSAVSPGTINCSLFNAPAFTVTDGDVFAEMPGAVMFEAVTVCVPAVLNVTLYICVPETSAAFAGSTAYVSDDVIPITSVTDETTFQCASTAFTVTLNDEPAVCADGDPVFPVALPASVLSPGVSSCSFVTAPGSTVTLEDAVPY